MKLRLLWTVWTLALSVTPVLADDFIVGQTYTFYSSVLDEDQTYTVNLPAGYNDDQAYPVVYLLEGYETQIRAVSGLAHALNGIASSMPPAIPGRFTRRFCSHLHSLRHYDETKILL